jgi:hypothetical protein
MGKCVRIRGSSKPRAAAAAAASCLTLCSGRRVPPSEASSACSPRTRSRPRRHRGAALRRWCGAKESAYGGSPRRRRRGEADARSPRGRVLGVGGARQQQLCADGHHGQQHEEEASATMAGDCDDGAGVAKVNKANKHENDECGCRVVVGVASHQTPSPPPPPTETEIEAFFAAAELAERRRFAEA